MVVCKYFVLFILYCFCGWVYESIYCTIVEHSWQNRGFLYGPCVPIYGVGAILVQIIFVDYEFIPNTNLNIFLFCAIGSFVMEYVTSYVLEKLFNARWWDYSNLPLNINGRVCLIFTVCFGLAGILLSNTLLEFVSGYTDMVPVFVFELVALLLMGVLGMDLALTISALTTFAKKFEQINDMINNQIAEKYVVIENNVVGAKNHGVEMYKHGKDSLIEKKTLTQEKLAEIKEQLSVEYITKALPNFSEAEKSQFGHIKTFSHPVEPIKGLIDKASAIHRSKKPTLIHKNSD